MNFSEAKQHLEALCRLEEWPFNGMICEFGEPYRVRERWFQPNHESQIPFAEFNGVYVYTSEKGDIWYIGKGEHEMGGGIGARCCSAHLGSARHEGEFMFPDHQWADQIDDQDIDSALRRGDFCIWTIKVDPSECCSLVEICLQTCCLRRDGQLPPLNRTIG